MITPVLSIIIVSYNTSQLTIDCLRSVFADKGLSDIPFEVIVIDNASTDDSVKLLKKLKYPITLIENKTNLGFAKANNQGFAKSSGNYILLLNSDTIILHSAISQAITWLSAHPEGSMCTAQLLNKDKSIQPSGGFFPNLVNTFCWSLGIDDLPLLNLLIPPIHPHSPDFYTHDPFFKKDHPQDWLTGAFILTRREIFEKTGGFDENYFMYAEELEWAYRVKKMFPLLSAWYLIGPQIIHLGGASSSNSGHKLLNEYQGIVYFFKKHQAKYTNIIRLFLKAGCHLRSLLNYNYRNLCQKI